jgi:tetratricopeptide (TPR) repeat protein
MAILIRSARLRGLAALLLLCVLAGPAFAEREHIDGLGSLDFPTSSTSAPARAAFLRGMLLMHLFEYPDAERAFQEAQRLDPGYAMAYWGEAMCATHPVWNQQDMARGRAALAKLGADAAARAAKAPTEREKAWLAIAELLYGEGDKPTRDARVEQALAALAERFPGDDEAQLFHALWLLGLGQGERQVVPFLRAADIAKGAYRRNPDHPGAAHYWIHGMDDPEHAQGAVEAADALSKIAPAAGHAQHMTAHIFMALGRWDDVVSANQAAERVVDANYVAQGRPPYACGHYAEWLQYAYFQQGRAHEGAGLLADCRRTGAEAIAWARAHPGEAYGAARTADALKERIDTSLVRMRGTAMVESGHALPDVATMDLDLSDVGDWRAWAAFARVLDAAQHGDPARARRHAAVVADALAEARANPKGEPAMTAQLAILAGMADAAVLHAEGDAPGADRLLATASAAAEKLPYEFGPPVTVKPVDELRGEFLLGDGKPAEALAAFDRVLRIAPQRRLALRGRARALSALHDPRAADAWQALAAVLHQADEGNADLAEARAAGTPAAKKGG